MSSETQSGIKYALGLAFAAGAGATVTAQHAHNTGLKATNTKSYKLLTLGV